jgi:hypothetical protein
MKTLETNLISIVPDIGKVESRLIDAIDLSSYEENTTDTTTEEVSIEDKSAEAVIDVNTTPTQPKTIPVSEE